MTLVKVCFHAPIFPSYLGSWAMITLTILYMGTKINSIIGMLRSGLCVFRIVYMGYLTQKHMLLAKMALRYLINTTVCE